MTTVLEYIWLDGNGGIRSKTKVAELDDTNNPPEWNYDGSSTGQAVGEDSEVILKPARLYMDPFRRGDSGCLVLCETANVNGTPHVTNHRYQCQTLFQQDSVATEEPMFGFEQEFFFINKTTGVPLGFPDKGFPKPQGDYYCGVGAQSVFGREIAEHVLANCLYTKLDITGYNFEVAPGQCEFQVCSKGIKACDDLIILRYILGRTAEMYGVGVTLHPKPVRGNWNGSGLHTNFSTKSIREVKDTYKDAISRLSEKHHEHLELYGTGNEERLTGTHETSSMDTFTWGVGDRTASVRVPNSVAESGVGYIEDRRPASNGDPYLIAHKLVETVLNV